MKHILQLLLSSVCLQLAAQFYPTETIAINNFSSRFSSMGSIAFDGVDAHFNVPKDSQIIALYAGELWLGGFDPGGNLHVSSVRYEDSLSVFKPGPIAASYGNSYNQRYNRVWKISNQQINYHRQHFNDVGYTAGIEITEWPGNGNPGNNEPLLLAPFEDLNGNHVYEPDLGDYPIIRGDEALYMIYSDRGGVDAPMGVDVHLMVYGYATSNSTLNNSLFLNYVIVNRSNNTYSNVLAGNWNDFDLGNYVNDYVGCDTTLSGFYVYNGTIPDETAQGLEGYGYKQAALGVKFLNTPMHAFGYFTNGFGPKQADPTTAPQFYNYMNGHWADGTPFTVGGIGYNTGAPTKFCFSGNPCDTAEWSELTSSMAANDRRAVGSVGPFNLPVGGSICIDLAYVFSSVDTGAACRYTVVDSLKQTMQEVQSFYNGSVSSCNTFVLGVDELSAGSLKLYPNPAQDRLIVELPGNAQYTLRLVEVSGREVMQIPAASSKLILSIAHLPAGVYLLTAETGTERLRSKVIIER